MYRWSLAPSRRPHSFTRLLQAQARKRTRERMASGRSAKFLSSTVSKGDAISRRFDFACYLAQRAGSLPTPPPLPGGESCQSKLLMDHVEHVAEAVRGCGLVWLRADHRKSSGLGVGTGVLVQRRSIVCAIVMNCMSSRGGASVSCSSASRG